MTPLKKVALVFYREIRFWLDLGYLVLLLLCLMSLPLPQEIIDQRGEGTNKNVLFLKEKKEKRVYQGIVSLWKKIRVFYEMRLDYLCVCKTELKSRNFLGVNGGGGHQSPNKF